MLFNPIASWFLPGTFAPSPYNQSIRYDYSCCCFLAQKTIHIAALHLISSGTCLMVCFVYWLWPFFFPSLTRYQHHWFAHFLWLWVLLGLWWLLRSFGSDFEHCWRFKQLSATIQDLLLRWCCLASLAFLNQLSWFAWCLSRSFMRHILTKNSSGDEKYHFTSFTGHAINLFLANFTFAVD